MLLSGFGLVEAGTVIPEGASWSYYRGTNTPAAQGGGGTATWTTITFDDSTWSSGPSGFGFGDEDDATVVSGMSNAVASLFTRKRFVIGNAAAVTHLALSADYDDGFVAYVNNQEVARRNVTGVPGQPITHTNTAPLNHEASRTGEFLYRSLADPQPVEFIDLDPSVLVSGTNVLAVSGHNISQSSSDFTLLVALFTNVTLIRGPVLQMQRAGRMTVTWLTDALADSAIDYGLDAFYGATATDTNAVREHAVELPPLAAGSTYYYRVRSAGVTLATNTFRAPAGAGQAFRIAAIGDFGSPTTNTAQIASLVASADPHLTFSVGDNIYQDGQPGSFDAHWFRPYRDANARAPVLTALGNHDINTASGIWTLANFYFPTNGPAGYRERNYSIDYGNAHLAFLDSNAFAEQSTNYFDATRASLRAAVKSWLSNDLAQTTQRWKIVVYHHPPYTSPGSHSDEALMKSDVCPILERYGVQFAFQGHNHWFERINPINGVNYITTGGGGFSLHTRTSEREFSAAYFNAAYSYTLVDVSGDALSLRCIDQTGAQRDFYRYDLGLPFLMDGLLDSTNWLRAQNGLRLNAAIRGRYLYVATQDSGEGSDNFIYLNSVTSTTRPANWAKSGQIMQWSAFLADENDGGFQGWFDAGGSPVPKDYSNYWSMTSGLNDNGTNANGVIEGALNLFAHFGSWPTQMLLAAAPFTNPDGGTNYAAAQVPAGNGDGNITADEFLTVATRVLALDLPVAEAGVSQTNEAGMAVTLDGSASFAPSGLGLSYQWIQVSGPSAALANASASLASAVLTNNVGAATTAIFRLTVNDTRFDSNDTMTVTFTPLADSDGDGLSDQEELTGGNNRITDYDPQGRLSNPLLPDTDGDGLSDAEESVAGTSPTNQGSVLAMAETSLAGSNVVIRWSSVSNRLYSIYESTNLGSPAGLLVGGLTGVAPANVYTAPAPSAVPTFHFIRVENPAP